MVAASLLPDIDILVALVDPTSAALERRMVTHSVILLPVLGVGLALLLRKIHRSLEFRTILLLILIGASIHLLLDIVNAYGVGLLFPISNYRFELPLLFITDPVIIGTLTAALAGAYLYRSQIAVRIWISRSAFVVIALYLGAALHFRNTARDILDGLLPSGANGPFFTYLTPEPLAPFRWKGIYADGDTFMQVMIQPLNRRVERLAHVVSDLNDPLVVRVRGEPIAREIENFLKAPIWSVRGRRVSVYDLRFRFSLLDNGWDPFGFEFHVDDDGVRLVETTIGERSRQVVREVLDLFGKPGSRKIGHAGPVTY